MAEVYKKSMEDINRILDILREEYPEADCALGFGSRFQLLVAVVLSAQTTDKSVNQVTPVLFERYPDAASLSMAGTEALEGILKRIGLYKTKSRNIVALSKELMMKYGGEVPEDYDKLVELPGVGRKTANVVLSVGFGHQRIAVDTHVFRVANRMGLAEGKDPLQTELSLMANIPEERWSEAHHSLIFHGRYYCNARKPQCGACPVAYMCRFALPPI